MSEIFNEIDEEVRRERLKKLWDKYSLLIIIVAVLIVAGVGGWRAYQYFEGKKAAQAGAAFTAAVELAEQKKHAEAEAAFDKIAATAPAGYRNLARLRAATEAAAVDPQKGVKLYDAIAADRAVPAQDRDLATLKAGQLLVDSAAYNDMVQRLEPISGPGAIYRHTARELLALSAWRANNVAATRQWIEQINLDPETPASLRNRAEVLQALLPPAAKS